MVSKICLVFSVSEIWPLNRNPRLVKSIKILRTISPRYIPLIIFSYLQRKTAAQLRGTLLTFAKAAPQLRYQPGVLPAHTRDMKYAIQFTQNGHLLEKPRKKKHEDSVGSLVSPSTNTPSIPHYHVPPARLLLMTAGTSPRWKE